MSLNRRGPGGTPKDVHTNFDFGAACAGGLTTDNLISNCRWTFVGKWEQPQRQAKTRSSGVSRAVLTLCDFIVCVNSRGTVPQ